VAELAHDEPPARRVTRAISSTRGRDADDVAQREGDRDRVERTVRERQRERVAGQQHRVGAGRRRPEHAERQVDADRARA
jgi:hypothetical protein